MEVSLLKLGTCGKFFFSSNFTDGAMCRYTVALGIGYLEYSNLKPERPPLFNVSPSIAQRIPSLITPRISTLLVVFFGLFVFFVAIAMIITIVHNARRSISAVQLERIRRWKIQAVSGVLEESSEDVERVARDARLRLWVPFKSSDGRWSGAVLMVEPGIPLFDFGSGQNWRLLMGDSWLEWLCELLYF